MAAIKVLFSNLNWGAWFYGLGAGFIGGGASAVTSGVVVSAIDPSKFALGGLESLKLMLWCFIVNGTLSMFFYLKTHPLPDRKADAAGQSK